MGSLSAWLVGNFAQLSSTSGSGGGILHITMYTFFHIATVLSYSSTLGISSFWYLISILGNLTLQFYTIYPSSHSSSKNLFFYNPSCFLLSFNRQVLNVFPRPDSGVGLCEGREAGGLRALEDFEHE